MLTITANEDGTYTVEISGLHRDQLDKCCKILHLSDVTALSFIFASGMKAITDLIYP